MKIPNKIYVDPKTIEEHILTKNIKEDDIEYVRKDKLLSLLAPTGRLTKEHFDRMWLKGYNDLRFELIERIKSM